jgi:hypothetical protein
MFLSRLSFKIFEFVGFVPRKGAKCTSVQLLDSLSRLVRASGHGWVSTA